LANQKTKNKQAAKSGLLCWTKHAREDYLFWYDNDHKKVDTIHALLEACIRDPFSGIGKPEPLKGDLTGYWSRRIDKEHRLVYLPENGNLYVLMCRYHY